MSDIDPTNIVSPLSAFNAQGSSSPNPGQPFNLEESSLRLRLLKAQADDLEFRIEKAKRDDARAEEESTLKMRQLRAQADKAELELANMKRDSARANATAHEAMEYTFSDAVTDASVKAAIAELGTLARRFPGRPLTFILTSPGGSVLHGFALYDYLRSLSKKGHKLTVQVFGMAASMGGILLQAGDVRQIGANSEVLIHEVSSGTQGKVSEQQDRIDFSHRLWDKLAKILSQRAKSTGKKTAMSAAQIKKAAFKYDWWLDAREAVRLGFADQII